MGVAPGEDADVEDADLVVMEYHSDEEEEPADEVVKRCVPWACVKTNLPLLTVPTVKLKQRKTIRGRFVELSA